MTFSIETPVKPMVPTAKRTSLESHSMLMNFDMLIYSSMQTVLL
jgi:hypothetical protein